VVVKGDPLAYGYTVADHGGLRWLLSPEARPVDVCTEPQTAEQVRSLAERFALVIARDIKRREQEEEA
jgi:hypothetical protein